MVSLLDPRQHVPIPTDNMSHGNSIEQVNTSPTNTNDSNDESINNTDTNEITNENQDDANNDNNTPKEKKCPSPPTNDKVMNKQISHP